MEEKLVSQHIGTLVMNYVSICLNKLLHAFSVILYSLASALATSLYLNKTVPGLLLKHIEI